MRPTLHSALIHFTLDVVGGVDQARAVLKEISLANEILAISSVYKRFLTVDHVDLSARLEFVIRIETQLAADQLLHLVLSLSRQGTQGIMGKTHAELTLLAFDNIIQMSPRLTLPYPSLHQDPVVIRCAAEAWGQYEHPIYQKNLSDISHVATPTRWTEFYMQGKSLVDF